MRRTRNLLRVVSEKATITGCCQRKIGLLYPQVGHMYKWQNVFTLACKLQSWPKCHQLDVAGMLKLTP